jgi:hypothetical protein
MPKCVRLKEDMEELEPERVTALTLRDDSGFSRDTRLNIFLSLFSRSLSSFPW